MNPNALRVPSLVLALSLLPDAVRADACYKAMEKMFETVDRVAWKVGHHAGALLNRRRYRTKQAILSRLRNVDSPWGIRIARGLGVSESNYDKGLHTLEQALQHVSEVGSSSFAGLRDIVITDGRDIFIRKSLFGSSTHVSIPYDAPVRSLERRLAAKLLELDLEKQFQVRLSLRKEDGLSHGGYADALKRLHSDLGAGRAPEKLRKVSGILVTKGGNVRVNHMQWSEEDRFLEGIDLTVPEDSMDAGLIVNAVLEAEAREMLGELGFTAMTWMGRPLGIANAMTNGGVDEGDYGDALRRFVGELRRRDPTDRPRRDVPGAGEGIRPDQVARIVVTPPGGNILLKPVKVPGLLPGLHELHVPVDRLSLESAFDTGRLLPAVSD